MTPDNNCPVCRNVDVGSCRIQLNDAWSGSRTEVYSFSCDLCGDFDADLPIYEWLVSARSVEGEPQALREIPKVKRALISHKLRLMQKTDEPCLITREWLEHLISDGVLPTPSTQAANMIRYIGDEVSRSGNDLPRLPLGVHAIIGAPNRKAAIALAKELSEDRILRLVPYSNSNVKAINLTLDGWRKYEEERHGHFEGNYGFLAMQYGDSNLESFVMDVLKPAITDLGYDLHDMRDVPEAGIIDNLMRVRIRDAKFVIADLTHDNNGVYFEAGYAEAWGKPVIYICERGKFDRRKTHFDTNHCTTILWSREDDGNFCQKLSATVRRSFDLA